MFKNQPKGLFALALANTGERFGYYTMLAIFTLFMQAKFGWDEEAAARVYAIFLRRLCRRQNRLWKMRRYRYGYHVLRILGSGDSYGT